MITNETTRRYRNKKQATDISGTDWGEWHVESRAGTYGRESTWWARHKVTGELAIKGKDYLRRHRDTRKAT